MEKLLKQNWDLQSLYEGGSQSEKLKSIMVTIEVEIEELEKRVEENNHLEEGLNMDKLLIQLGQTQERMSEWLQIDEYLICLYADNVRDSSASTLLSYSAEIHAKLASLLLELDTSLLKLSEESWHNFLQKKEVEPFRFYLEERRQETKGRLPIETEKLIRSMSVNGFAGWESHYKQLLNKLKVSVVKEGIKKEISIGEALHGVAFTKDRSTRIKYAQAIKEVCEENQATFASTLNHFAGFRLDLYQQRGWENVLKETLEQNRISEESLHSMMEVINENNHLVREFAKRKLALEKVESPAYYDIRVSSFSTETSIPYEEAVHIIVSQFRGFSEKLGDFAERAFEQGWVEVEDRPDKASGAFCASMPLTKESRIFLTYKGSYQDVVTLAHELGHAYHNEILMDVVPFAREKGTAVAETASTFLENLVLDAAISNARDEREKLALLEKKVINGLKYISMIPNMFIFEQKLYEKRQQGLLSAEEIKALMLETEKELYGDLIQEFDLMKWIYISHFYSADKAFYNIPYTIGYLFSNGIYAIAKEKGDSFPARYDELLRNSGRMTMEQLAEQYLQQDLRKKDFWKASLQPVREGLEEYLSLTERMI
ncbi:M3 family oligoendopeptidase [Bacillus sp. 2205SS5-2]|uniref:M3 family oligoendopeptidase n=1 Tax=Bacillus sp. 2205SS5-2 TaxID=3109031 RepID=UPI003006AAA7